MEEINRRSIAEISNEVFVTALVHARQEELRTALLIEAEMHKVPNSAELAVLTEYEKALERVRNGAGISPVIPINRRLAPEYSLTGSSAALL